jgi:protein TonB
VAGAATELSLVRAGANRSFALALLASLLLHALALAVLPSLRELAAQLPPVTVPLVARLAQPPTASSPPPAVQAAPRPAPHRPPVAPTAPPRAAETPALPPVARQAPREPVAQAAAAPAPQPAPAAPMQATSEPPAPAASGALARLEPLPAPAALPGPDPGALERYRLQLVTAAARFKRYPRSAIDNNWEGAVVVRMAIGADGRIAALGVARSSGHEVLDRQALEMFRTAKPFVQLPRELEGREFELELRAIYSLRDQPSG